MTPSGGTGAGRPCLGEAEVAGDFEQTTQVGSERWPREFG